MPVTGWYIMLVADFSSMNDIIWFLLMHSCEISIVISKNIHQWFEAGSWLVQIKWYRCLMKSITVAELWADNTHNINGSCSILNSVFPMAVLRLDGVCLSHTAWETAILWIVFSVVLDTRCEIWESGENISLKCMICLPTTELYLIKVLSCSSKWRHFHS